MLRVEYHYNLESVLSLQPCDDQCEYVQGTAVCPAKWPRTEPPVSSQTVKSMLDRFVAILGSDKLVKPDALRGNFSTLVEALKLKGAVKFWPDVDSVRGKFFIIGGGMILNDIDALHAVMDLCKCRMHEAPCDLIVRCLQR